MLRKFWNWMTGKYYWYSVRVKFIKDGKLVVYRDVCVGLPTKNLSLSRRYMAKILIGKNEIYENPLLHGCDITITVLSGLGYIKRPKGA